MQLLLLRSGRALQVQQLRSSCHADAAIGAPQNRDRPLAHLHPSHHATMFVCMHMSHERDDGAQVTQDG